MSSLIIKPFYHQMTSTISYLVYDRVSLECAIIDSVLDYDAASGRLSFTFVNEQIDYIQQHKLKLKWILETHAHADHLTAASYIKAKLNGQIAVGKNIIEVQKIFKTVFSLTEKEISLTGNEFDKLLSQGDQLSLGELTISVIETPGHTQDGLTYVIDGNAFVGDTLFMPDAGTARCDFPGGSSQQLYQSIHKIYALPEETKLWMCHDYQPNDRDLMFQTTVADSKQFNIHVNHATELEVFSDLRIKRDGCLAAPKLLYPALQVNIRAGELPEFSFERDLVIKGKPLTKQSTYLKLPIFIT